VPHDIAGNVNLSANHMGIMWCSCVEADSNTESWLGSVFQCDLTTHEKQRGMYWMGKIAGNRQQAKKGSDDVEPEARMPVHEPCREAACVKHARGTMTGESGSGGAAQRAWENQRRACTATGKPMAKRRATRVHAAHMQGGKGRGRRGDTWSRDA
jgi:hypothetical protein